MNNMYQFSLSAFLRLFQRNLERTEVSRRRCKRSKSYVFSLALTEGLLSRPNTRSRQESTSHGLCLHHSLTVQSRSSNVRHASRSWNVSKEGSRSSEQIFDSRRCHWTALFSRRNGSISLAYLLPTSKKLDRCHRGSMKNDPLMFRL